MQLYIDLALKVKVYQKPLIIVLLTQTASSAPKFLLSCSFHDLFKL
jgi:hypothetical protein